MGKKAYMERTDRIVYLLERYMLQDISPEELSELLAWCASHPAYQKLLSEFGDQEGVEKAYQAYKEPETKGTLSYDAIWEKIQVVSPAIPKKRILGFKKWLSIAALLLIIGVGLWIVRERYLPLGKVDSATLSFKETDSILPGRTRAQLVLNTGKKIELNGQVSNVTVGAGKVSYADGINLKEFMLTDATLQTLVVPKGGEFKMKLPDGSLVWLNASSSLRFPSRFSGHNREVELIGEAYFEVSRNEKQPFIVKSRQQEVQVLGTSFNIKAYQDDELTITTLVEGKVNVSSKGNNMLLLPGEEASIDQRQQLRKYRADLDRALSWQRGEFVFNRTSVYEVMKEIGRWYNVEVAYAHGVPDEYFTGQLNRSVDFEVVLRFLKESGINYNMQARKITVL